MSPEQQRIAIAKACGWTNVAPLIVKNVKHEGDDITVGISSDDGWIPDYLNDRNAMHEAKRALLDKGLMLEFVNLLVVIICYAKGISWSGITTDDRQMLIANATVAQEAETFLKVFKLWEEKQIPEPSFHSYHKEDAQ